LIAVRVVTGELAERPVRVRGDGRASERDRYDVIPVAVDDKDGAAAGTREALERSRT
jgi:hypothetical protein